SRLGPRSSPFLRHPPHRLRRLVACDPDLRGLGELPGLLRRSALSSFTFGDPVSGLLALATTDPRRGGSGQAGELLAPAPGRCLLLGSPRRSAAACPPDVRGGF